MQIGDDVYFPKFGTGREPDTIEKCKIIGVENARGLLCLEGLRWVPRSSVAPTEKAAAKMIINFHISEMKRLQAELETKKEKLRVRVAALVYAGLACRGDTAGSTLGVIHIEDLVKEKRWANLCKWALEHRLKNAGSAHAGGSKT